METKFNKFKPVEFKQTDLDNKDNNLLLSLQMNSNQIKSKDFREMFSIMEMLNMLYPDYEFTYSINSENIASYFELYVLPNTLHGYLSQKKMQEIVYRVKETGLHFADYSQKIYNH
jgi:hypothetical protein